MSELSERITSFWSRLGGERTQLVAASVVAVGALVAASLALPGSDDETPAGSLSERAPTSGVVPV